MSGQPAQAPAPYVSPGPQTTAFEVLERTTSAFSFYGVLARFVQWLERSGRTLVIALPFLWLGLFFLAPFLIVLKLSFSETVLAVPPYAPLVAWLEENGLSYLTVRLNLSNYLLLFEDSLYVRAFLNSLRISAVATFLTLCVALPLANAMSRAPERWRALLLMMVILPFWTSFLIRVYAWIGILKPEGILNAVLIGLGVISEPLTILNTDIAVYIGIVYSYLPFMVLPIYASFEKMDPSLIEAAVDLGSPPIKAFWTITVRIALPGIIAGCLLVFIPAAGEFVIPDLLGGSETLMIGRTLWLEFFNNRDWPLASAVAIVLLAALTVPIVLFQRHQARRGGEGGAS
ncbi:MAG: ABC transporter permease subunit [Defluviicoccus sp.]|nr:ABC transporter permease subunit [Defluviicoccus sp.]MDG4609804.1 ABC transporter permease subunit [Defluviicoccus sp.]